MEIQNFQEQTSVDMIKELTREIQRGDLETAKMLIDKVVLNPSYYELVFFVLALERKEIFHHLLQKPNLDINMLNRNGESLLYQSLRCTDQYFLNEILKKGVSLDENLYKKILHNAVKLNNPTFVNSLLRYGASMDNEDIMGLTPLYIAVENSNLEIVSMLLYYNCDISSNNYGNMSPFLYSLFCGSDEEIQLLLLEYETDMNNTNLMRNNLFVAVERCPNLIPHIISHGADVNQICNDRNIIDWISEHPIESNLFKIIWDSFKYETWESTFDESILMIILSNSSLRNSVWNDYLRIIIESSQIQYILNTEIVLFLSLFVEGYINRGFIESDFYDLICVLLANGCTVHAVNIHKVYNLLGNTSRILKLLIHMDVNTTRLNVDLNFIRVRYSFNNPVNQILRNFLLNMKVFNMVPSYKDILRYFTVPPKVKNYLQNHKSVTCPFEITWNHVVPSLVELSRNKSRDYICKKYNVKTSGKYYSIINHCILPKIIKDILTFEKPLYFHK